MQLSTNFSLENFVKSNQATKAGIPNLPNTTQLHKMFYLCQYILQPTRDKWGVMRVTSGLRVSAVNKLVGGSRTSQHVKGEAGDFKHMDKLAVFNWMSKNLTFGQLIIYDDLPNIIHVSLPRLHKPNQMVMERIKGKYYSI